MRVTKGSFEESIFIANLLFAFDYSRLEQEKQVEPIGQKGEKMLNGTLENIPTVKLVEELSRREGVEKIIIEPHEDKEISVNGPMIVLKVID